MRSSQYLTPGCFQLSTVINNKTLLLVGLSCLFKKTPRGELLYLKKTHGDEPNGKRLVSSPAPSLGSTPSVTPHTYTDTTYTPVERDYVMDYESVLTSVEDVNRFDRFMFGGGVRRVRTGSRCEVHTRKDVIPVLSELRDMLNRLFDIL